MKDCQKSVTLKIAVAFRNAASREERSSMSPKTISTPREIRDKDLGDDGLRVMPRSL